MVLWQGVDFLFLSTSLTNLVTLTAILFKRVYRIHMLVGMRIP